MKELVEIQSKLKAPKNNYNSFGKYKYRSAEDILEAVKPLAAERGCVVLLSDEAVCIEGRFYVVATARIINSEGKELSAKGWAQEVEQKAGMDPAQITGAASSYARKYALNGLFAIDDTKDADAINTQEQGQTQPQPQNADLEKAFAEIKAATTVEQLKAIHTKYASVTNISHIVAALSMRRKELGV